MRKIIFGICSFVIFFVNVKAEVVYYVDKDNKTGAYLSNYSLGRNNYSYFDFDDKLYLGYNDWQDKCDVDENLYDVTYKTFYGYQDVISVKYIILSNIDDNLSIKNIEIFNDNDLIEYEIEYDQNIKIILDKVVNPASIKINIEFEGINVYDYKILFYDEKFLNKVLEIDTDTTVDKLNFFNSEFLVYGDLYFKDSYVNIAGSKYLGTFDRCRFREYLVYYYNYLEFNDEGDLEDNDIFDYEHSLVSYEIKDDINNELDKDNFVNNSSNAFNNELKDNDNRDSDVNFREFNPNNKFINTLKVSNDKSVVKYIIIVVIGLTILYIMFSNYKKNKSK